MEYKIIITKTWDGKDFTKIRKRINQAIDDFWFFVEDCPEQEIFIYKNGVDITKEIRERTDLKDKYYKGLGIEFNNNIEENNYFQWGVYIGPGSKYHEKLKKKGR